MSSFLFSCEYATYAVPGEYAHLYVGHQEALSCSRGWEPGALNLAQACAMRFRTPLVHSEASRLLIDVEAPKDHCWSRFSEVLSGPDQRRLLERYWQSYRNQLMRRISVDLERHSLAFHVMVHTDPDQREHVQLHIPDDAPLAESLAGTWLKAMQRNDLRCALIVGKAMTDLSSELTANHDSARYAQVRINVHQDFFLMGTPWRWATIKKHLLDSLAISANRVESMAIK